MKILKLLNKKYLSIFIVFFCYFLSNLRAEDEPVDIWNLEKKTEQNSSFIVSRKCMNLMKLKLNRKKTDPNKHNKYNRQ